ncbi:MAG: hypothetical protein K8S14_08175 [Actinomycetia bacterium]|nr:hypothetical protein [Actinomycetes bacterium]
MVYNITIFISVHILICLIYSAFILYRENLQQSIFRFAVIFLLPVLGPIFFLLAGLFSRILKETENVEKTYQEYVKGDGHINYVEVIDFQKEINIIPLNDSLILGTRHQRRLFLADLLKKDYSRYIKVLQRAVSDEDSETSHYAGAALIEIKKQFEELIYSADEEYKKHSSDIGTIRKNINTIKKYLNSGLPDEIEKKEFTISLSHLLEKYLAKDHTRKKYFIDKISLDLKLKNYKDAEKYCKSFCRYFPDEQKPYFMLLKFFYSTSNLKTLKEISGLIKDKQFNLSEENKQILDYWERFAEGAV